MIPWPVSITRRRPPRSLPMVIAPAPPLSLINTLSPIFSSIPSTLRSDLCCEARLREAVSAIVTLFLLTPARNLVAPSEHRPKIGTRYVLHGSGTTSLPTQRLGPLQPGLTRTSDLQSSLPRAFASARLLSATPPQGLFSLGASQLDRSIPGYGEPTARRRRSGRPRARWRSHGYLPP